ncbi:MAG: 50S ribosomal protein L9 [Limnochordia bacterium]|jgi:large subunit ribosomal protein L9|nr:50S ribosomal protein L9 [Bacillota bacterium]NLL09153.1 50S ribosomal protein L9 [Bacillota bacterium]HBG10520.1 50S ribosomal protein L9 [Bacillota bacterium]
MKVILQADIKNLGKKGDVVEVSEGYGRNYLLPRGLAVEASSGNLRHAAQQKQKESAKAERELKEAQKIGEKIKDQQLKVGAKVGEGGRLFGSVTPQEIADQLRRQFAVEIDKRKIDIKEPIKSLGTHPVVVKVHPKVHVTVLVNVVDEQA